MNEIVSWAALALGVGLILTHLTVAIAAAVKAPGGDIRMHSDSTRRVFDLLERLVHKTTFVAAGVVLVFIAAMASGAFRTTVVLGH
ncbi:MAG: hypothetical protein ABIR17_09375 [Pseudolysinimonas sp.]|uniref:hypothetical protein n=1 Tax=Pseudolysinimonas sp. TaxID=2680009 RepID=UPI003265466B